jgi:hypothetical protein
MSNLLFSHDIAMAGTMLAIDPSSGSRNSMPGYAYFEAGELLDSGTIPVDYKKPVFKRLEDISNFLVYKYRQPDILVIEKIRGFNSHIYLHWAVGAIIAAVSADEVVEIPTATWRKYRGPNYDKTDENDAVLMGQTILILAEANLGATHEQ